MMNKNSYCHAFRFDKPIKLATDNVVGYIPQAEYSPSPPPAADFFLLLDNTNFLLLDNTDLLLL